MGEHSESMKKTKSSRRLIVQNAIEKHIFAFVLIHQPKQANDTEDYRFLEIGMQFKKIFFLYNQSL